MFSVPLFMFIFTKADMVSYSDCELLWLLAERREKGGGTETVKPSSSHCFPPAQTFPLCMRPQHTDLDTLPLNLMMLLGSFCCFYNVHFLLIMIQLIHVQILSPTAPSVSFAPLQTCSNCVLFFLHICIFNKVFCYTFCGNIIIKSIKGIFIFNFL